MWQALETKARFIAPGHDRRERRSGRPRTSAARSSRYAEVKAIASGNPAVLTLAEADAELQRLAILRKHHADEQYLARRNVRELPEAIARLRGRLAELEADLETSRGPTRRTP